MKRGCTTQGTKMKQSEHIYGNRYRKFSDLIEIAVEESQK